MSEYVCTWIIVVKQRVRVIPLHRTRVSSKDTTHSTSWSNIPDSMFIIRVKQGTFEINNFFLCPSCAWVNHLLTIYVDTTCHLYWWDVAGSTLCGYRNKCSLIHPDISAQSWSMGANQVLCAMPHPVPTREFGAEWLINIFKIICFHFLKCNWAYIFCLCFRSSAQSFYSIKQLFMLINAFVYQQILIFCDSSID